MNLNEQHDSVDIAVLLGLMKQGAVRWLGLSWLRL
jgi:hypothetical protein